ncbi:alpha/beta hydrolase [uncultured Shimia sp.]|uniref:alpha/beta hydrolase n=1 Tax=uncultured Shimia sp. TaxID=573152 RepID=UPI0025EDFD8B|nr:alpha/beta hydrolase [uncultured Shimia sp.]
MAQFLFRLCAFSVVFAFMLVVAAPLLERLMIYPLDDTRVSPADADLPTVTEEVFHHDGQALIVWTAPPAPGKPVIFYLHGNAGNLANRASRFDLLLQRGYGLVAPAYRGYSGSTGTPQEAAIIGDTVAIYDSIVRPMKAPVVVYGESIGAAVTLGVIEAGITPDAILLEAPYTSLKAMAAHHYPGNGGFTKHLSNQWDSLFRARRVTLPLLILHGTKDELIPIDMGRQIFTAAPSIQKEFVEAPGAGHTGLWRTDTWPKLTSYINQFALR